MKKTSLPNRAISVVLSALMAFTLVPSAAFAAGADAAASDVESTAPTATDDTASASDTANQDAHDTSADANAAPEDAAASSVISEQHALDASVEHGQAAAGDDTPEMVRAAVSVQANGDQAGTLLSYNGLSFQVSTNAEGTPTAALVGLTTAASGTLEIPAQIVSNGTTYHVTNISSNKELRGGAAYQSDSSDVDPTQTAADGATSTSAPAGNDSATNGESDASASVNPYTTELYTDAQKAPGITSISIPASVTTVDPGFFQLFPNASAISVEAGNSAFISYNGMLFGTNDAGDPTDLLLVPEGLEGNAVLPDSLANVPVCTFSRCSKLTAIHVESGSTGDLALEGTSFTSRDGILYTHDENDALVLVAAPAGIGASAKIAAECTIIAEGAFWGNEALRTIVAQGTVEGIEVNPVFDPEARANAQGEGAAGERGESGEGANGTEGDAAQGDTPTAPVPAFMPQVVENATVVSQDNARGTWEAAGFTHFSHPAQPGAISGPAWGNSGLSYTLLDDFTLSVRWQGDAPATTVEIPAQSEIDSVAYSVSTIAEGAFQDQSELTSITIPNSVTTIGAHAFAGCSALADVAVPGSVAALPEGAFKDTIALRQVTLNEGVQEIGEQAFAGSAVETMFLPRSMRTVRAEAFADCQNLNALVALGNVATVSTTAIADANGVSIYVPFNADEDYAWTTGLPTAGNHLLPYGVKAVRDVFNLEEGQSADLFAEGGYAYASDQAQLQVSYKGKAVTADASGTVTAKMPGSSTVTASVVFQDRTLASATCTVKVVHAAVEDGEGDEGGEGDGASTEEGGEDDAEADEGEEGTVQPEDEESIEGDEEDSIAVRPPMNRVEAPLDPVTDSLIERPGMITGEADLSISNNKNEQVVDSVSSSDIYSEEVQIAAPFEETVGKQQEAAESDGQNDNGKDETLKATGVAEVVDGMTFVSCQSALKSVAEVLGDEVVIANKEMEGTEQLTDDSEAFLEEEAVMDSELAEDALVQISDDSTEDNEVSDGSESTDDTTEEKELAAVATLGSARSAIMAAVEARSYLYHTISWNEGAHGGYIIKNHGRGSDDKIDWTGVTNNIRYGGDYSATVKYSSNPSTKYGVLLTGWVIDSDGRLIFRTDYTYSNYSVSTISDIHWTIQIVPDAGYKFAGWSGSKGTYVASDVNGYQALTNTKYTATYSPITYTATYDANGGTFSNGTSTSTTNFTIESNGFSAPADPTRPGYRFRGYYLTGAINSSNVGTNDLLNGNASGTGWYGNATYTAQWEPIDYYLALYTEGGKYTSVPSGWMTSAGGSTATTVGTTSATYYKFNITNSTITLPTVTRNDWTFVGWQFGGDLVTNVASKIGSGYQQYNPISITKLPSSGTGGLYGSCTIEAVWRCTLTLDCSKHTKSPADGSTNNGKQYVYYYDWWREGSSNSGDFFSSTAATGSSIPSAKTNSAKATAAGSRWTSTIPTSAGCTLKGWYTSSSGGTKKLTNEGKLESATTSISGNTTWHAQWDTIYYFLELVPRSGAYSKVPAGWRTSESGSTDTSVGSSATSYYRFDITTSSIPLPTVTRTNWDFVGWEFSGDLVTNCATNIMPNCADGVPLPITEIGSSGNYGACTVRAVWRCKLTLNCSKPSTSPEGTYTSSQAIYYYSWFNGKGASGSRFSKQMASDIAIPNTTELETTAGSSWVTNIPTAKGYTLKGWYTSSSDGTKKLTNEGKLETVTTSISGNTTWYAQWDAIEYEITLDPAGGEFPAGKSGTVTYTVGQQNVPFYSTSTGVEGWNPTRTGAVFVGWRCTSHDAGITDGWATGGKVFPNFYTGTSNYGNYALKAVWRIDITLDGHAPTQPSGITVTQTTSTIYYYPDFGYRETAALTGVSWPATSTFIQRGEQIISQAPTCSDSGYGYYGYSNATNGGQYMIGSASGNHLVITTSTPPTSAITWYAFWWGNTYTVTLNPNPPVSGGQNDAVQSGVTKVNYIYGHNYLPSCQYGGSGSTVHIPVPTKSGWTFAGYYDSAGKKWYETGAAQADPGHLGCWAWNDRPYPKGNFELTAKWTRNITLDPNDGTIAGTKYITATYGEALPSSIAANQVPSSPTNKPAGVTWTFAAYYDSQDYSSRKMYYDRDGARCVNTVIKDTSLTTLYSWWDRSVTIDGNGGSNGQTTITVTKGVALSKITSRWLRGGYTLKGYYSAKSGGNLCYAANGDPDSSCTSTTIPATIYAQWDADPASINFNLNSPSGYSATGAPSTIMGVTDQVITNPALPSVTPTCSDHTFAGWYTSATGGNLITSLPIRFPAGTTMYYAHWTAKPDAVITFKAEGDSLGAGHLRGPGAYFETSIDISLRPDTGIMTSNIQAIPDTAYELEGWYLGSTKLSEAEYWSPERPSGGWVTGTTYVAKFRQKTYTITYYCAQCGSYFETEDCEHASGIGDLPTEFKLGDICNGNSVRIGSPEMKPYYVFDGWSGAGIDPDHGGYPLMVELSDASEIGDKQYNLQCYARAYTLSLDANVVGGGQNGGWGGTAPDGFSGSSDGTGDHQLIYRTYNVEDGAFALPTPVWPGHTFDGWVYNGTSVGPTFVPSFTNYGDKMLTATWSTNPYQITYELGDDLGFGVLPEGADNPYNYSYDSPDITLPIPTRVGYDFAGWTEEEVTEDGVPAIEGSDPQIDVIVPARSWGNRTFKAHWRAHEYDIVFDLDKGVWDGDQPDNPMVAVYDSDVTMPKTPKRVGYIFMGWRFMRTMEGATVIEDYEPGLTYTRPNFLAQVGEAAYPDVSAHKGSVTIEAVWTPNLAVDVVVGSEGVHMGVQLKGGTTREPFETTDGTATLRNRSDGALKVVSVTPNASSDYDALKANALQLFREEGNLARAQFSVRPARGNVATMQVGTFGIADADRSLTLIDDTAYSSPDVDATGPNHARNWMMEAAGSGNEDLRLIYRLDMGTLQPNDIDLSSPAGSQLHVADLVYKVALVLP